MIDRAYQQGFIRECYRYGVDPRILYKYAAAPHGYQGLSAQRYLPISERRNFSDDEEDRIDRESGKWIPKIFRSYEDDPSVLLSSPDKAGLLTGVLAGTTAGALAAPAGAGWGVAAGLGAGGLAYLLARVLTRVRNKNVKENMRRLPEGATLRDYQADPLYQANVDRSASAANVRAAGNALLLASMLAR